MAGRTSYPIKTYSLPPAFWRDHDNRDLLSGVLVGKKGGRFLVECDDQEIREILSDARYYADPTGAPDWPEGAGIRASARATVRAIEAQRPDLAP